MNAVEYGNHSDVSPDEISEFYQRLNHRIQAEPEQIARMLRASAVFVSARVDGKLIGLARGVCDGVRGYLTECKLDPAYQGPGAVTRTDGRIEDDREGIAREMASRVLDRLFAGGAERVDSLAYGTEVDFCEELGFKRATGCVGVTMSSAAWSGSSATAAASAASEER